MLTSEKIMTKEDLIQFFRDNVSIEITDARKICDENWNVLKVSLLIGNEVISSSEIAF